MAPDPYSSVAEPLRISMRFAMNGSTVTAWSPLVTDTSRVSMRSFEHAHPGSVEAVNDRAARRDPEGTVVDARFVGDRGADAVGDLALEFLTGNYVAGLGDALRGKRVADDKDFFDDGVRPFGRRILREGERRQTSCQREW